MSKRRHARGLTFVGTAGATGIILSAWGVGATFRYRGARNQGAPQLTLRR